MNGERCCKQCQEKLFYSWGFIIGYVGLRKWLLLKAQLNFQGFASVSGIASRISMILPPAHWYLCAKAIQHHAVRSGIMEGIRCCIHIGRAVFRFHLAACLLVSTGFSRLVDCLCRDDSWVWWFALCIYAETLSKKMVIACETEDLWQYLIVSLYYFVSIAALFAAVVFYLIQSCADPTDVEHRVLYWVNDWEDELVGLLLGTPSPSPGAVICLERCQMLNY